MFIYVIPFNIHSKLLRQHFIINSIFKMRGLRLVELSDLPRAAQPSKVRTQAATLSAVAASHGHILTLSQMRKLRLQVAYLGQQVVRLGLPDPYL